MDISYSSAFFESSGTVYYNNSRGSDSKEGVGDLFFLCFGFSSLPRGGELVALSTSWTLCGRLYPVVGEAPGLCCANPLVTCMDDCEGRNN